MAPRVQVKAISVRLRIHLNKRKSLYGPASKAMVLYKMGMVPLGIG